MPPNRTRRNSSPPPEVMTWGRAMPTLVVCALVDAIRFMFEWFIFFGPALAGIFCTIKASAVVGMTAASFFCGAGAGAIGFFGAGGIETFGILMAMATGFAGWLLVGFGTLMTNARIFKENGLLFAGSLLVSEVPIIGSIPAITLVMWRMYRNQIRIETAALKKWKKENADAQAREREQEEAQFMQNQIAEAAPADVY